MKLSPKNRHFANAGARLAAALFACWNAGYVLAEGIAPSAGMLAEETGKPSIGEPEDFPELPAATTQPAESSSEPKQTTDAGAYLLAKGDTLLVKFYKYAGISGEFLIRPDGTISIPPLGSIPLAGKTIVQAEAALANSLSALTQRRAFASVEVSKYRPIYVVGWVDRAGSFAWTPDLLVLQAVTLAGGFQRVPDNVAADSDREAGQLTEAAEMLARAIARKARIGAEMERNKTLEAPQQLASLVSIARAKDIVDGERRLLEGNLSIRQSKKRNLERMLSLAEEEVQALSQRLTAVASGIEIKSQMAAKLNDLLTKGNTTIRNVSDIESEVARLQSEQGQLLADLAQAKQRLNTAKFELDRDDTELLQELQHAITETERDIAKFKTEMSTSKTVLKRYGAIGCPRGVSSGEPIVAYQIVRRSVSQVDTFDVDESTPVEPGDTVRVRQINESCAG